MRAMTIKLGRDLWRQRMQCLAIVMIVACGVASQITSFGLIETLRSAMSQYYDRARFPDLFVHLDSMPLSHAARLGSVSGVKAVQPRIVWDAPLLVPDDLDDPASATLIAVPSEYEDGINRLVIRQGAALSELEPNQVIVSEIFAHARSLRVGDPLQVTVQGRRWALTVAGIAISPEFLFQIREGAGVPDNRRYAVLWMSYQDLARRANMEGLVNDLVVSVKSDRSMDIVKEQLRKSISTRGNVEMHDRNMQVSHRYTCNSIAQLYSVAIVPPAIFLAVASFLIYIATSRLVKTERENIAMQRAFGYSAIDVGKHYFLFITIVVLAGCMVGILGGMVLAQKAIGIYNDVYRFPELPLRVSAWSLAYSMVASMVAGVIGGGYAVWKVALMPPAMGLRPEPPASYRLTWHDHIAGWLKLSPISRMVLRGIGRWPLRTFLGVMGIALGIGVMVLGSYTQGAIAYVIDFEFFLTRRYDVMVQFAPGTSVQAIDEVQHLKGVLRSEPFESGRFLIRSGHRDRRVTLIGIPRESQLLQPVSHNLHPIELRGHGVALSCKLAEALAVDVGASLEVAPLIGDKQAKELRAECLVTDYAGLNAYVDLVDFQRWFRQGESASGVFLQLDANELQSVTRELNRRPRVLAVTIKSAALENYQANDSKNLLLFRIFNMLFSGVIGIGAVYSVASISLIERQRDLALLRVLGYSTAETGRVLIGELVLMSLFAIPIGCASGYAFASIATWILNSETQRIPLWIHPTAYGTSVLVSLISCFVSACIIQRRVNQLDCIAQLKSKD
jgi:putative ABC transport system permease protein